MTISEDGSLRIQYCNNTESVHHWLQRQYSPSTPLAYLTQFSKKSIKIKKRTKPPHIPVDFFENCTRMQNNELEVCMYMYNILHMHLHVQYMYYYLSFSTHFLKSAPWEVGVVTTPTHSPDSLLPSIGSARVMGVLHHCSLIVIQLCWLTPSMPVRTRGHVTITCVMWLVMWLLRVRIR